MDDVRTGSAIESVVTWSADDCGREVFAKGGYGRPDHRRIIFCVRVELIFFRSDRVCNNPCRNLRRSDKYPNRSFDVPPQAAQVAYDVIDLLLTGEVR